MPPVVVIAGKAGSGKSKLLRNVFNIDTESGMNPDGVTKEIITKFSKCNGAEMILYDIPGLDCGVPYEMLLRKNMQSLTTQQDYIFLYTLRAHPGARVDQFDDYIIKNLSNVLGEQLWDKCVLLLTFSDTTLQYKYKHTNNKEEYKEYLKTMTLSFQSKLKKYKPSVTIKTIFELGAEIYDEPATTSSKQDIIVIPTACSANYDSNMLLPDIVLNEGHNWTDLVFVALLRLVPAEERRERYSAFRNLKEVAVVAGIGVGALVGSFVGGGVGAVAGAFVAARAVSCLGK